MKARARNRNFLLSEGNGGKLDQRHVSKFAPESGNMGNSHLVVQIQSGMTSRTIIRMIAVATKMS